MIELGLQRISRLLAATPLPWRAVHVAGTNGKGSICAYVSAMLDVYNKSTWRSRRGDPPINFGMFNSPHLVDRWDCISINQKTIPASAFHDIEANVLRRNAEESVGASEFELLTATAFEAFTTKCVDVAVVEVGLGGRLDATNVIGQTEQRPPEAQRFRPPPLVTAFASIGLDHQEFLGHTLEAIAAEKAGILKPGVPVVYDWSNPANVNEVIHAMAERLRCAADGQRYDVGQRAKHLGLTSLLDAPSHVRHNSAVALQATWCALERLGRMPTSDTKKASALDDLERDMLKVVETVRFPGRQQTISIRQLTGRQHHVLLDGAHNHQSALALAQAVGKLRGGAGGRASVTWVLAASGSKDVKEILSPLIKNGDSVFAVEFGPVDGMPWVKPLPTAKLLDMSKALAPESLCLHDHGNDLRSAIQAASDRAGEGPLVIAGSLYLVGDVLRLLRGD
ncbi:Mur ligase [Neohortaea acidophila]|uniref:Mur ligase n=1 Tax=Neohortaea acidophila TaxID=245834 RepID=A0A6A6PJ80_9PEZI|nr:Mur ligase [Neohortaea acidophila]KAF2480089.1 Mur ligase [Neohortaea acidophila]